MSKQWRNITVLAFVMTIAGAILAGAQSSQATSDTYTWNGEFVSLDTTAKTMAVKSRVAYQEAISELKHFKAGDRVAGDRTCPQCCGVMEYRHKSPVLAAEQDSREPQDRLRYVSGWFCSDPACEYQELARSRDSG